jgi:hypothetical protein
VKRWKQTPLAPSELLPGLEQHPDTIRRSKAAEVQKNRQDLGMRLAAVLAGGPITIHETERGPVIVNKETGEVLEDEASAYAALLQLAAADENHLAALMAQDGGGAFFGGTALWKSSLRVDPNWMEAFRRRSRQRANLALRKMMEALPPEEKAARANGWRHRLTLKLLTLTMPHASGKSQLQEVERFQAAWTLFRKRDFWKARCWGGVKGVEDALSPDGSHVHGHVLNLSRFLEPVQLREEWRECVDQATRTLYGWGLAEDCPVIVDVRIVTKRGRARAGGCELEEALQETCKYVTKPSDFLEPDEDGRTVDAGTILEVCQVQRWPRMFELLGEARMRGKKATTGRERADAALAALVSIHRAYLTAGPMAIPENLRVELADRGAFDVEDDQESLRRVVAGLRDLAERGPKRERPPTWRELLGRIPFGDWLRLVVKRCERGRKFRMRWLLEHNPTGIFCVFDGSVLTNPDKMYA